MNQPLVPAETFSRRIPELDGLRGIAILLVISFHYINNQLAQATTQRAIILAKVTSLGWVGVDLFFVLSGFLIGSILLKNKNSKNYFSSFYIRRFIRIVPNYYLLIAIFLIVLAVPWFKGNYFLVGNNVLPSWSYFLMVHNFYMATQNNMGTDAMSITWSIGIEEQFYIAFPFIVYYIKDKWLPFILITAIIAALVLRTMYAGWIPPYVLLQCRMDAISFGALVAWVNYKHNLKALSTKYFKLLITLIIADILICAYLFARYNDLGTARHTLFAIVFCILLIFALTYNETWYGKLLRNRVLVWVGTISYSLYLFHYLILGLFNHINGNTNGIAIHNLQDALISVGALATSIIFSWMVYRFLESPGVNWGKRFKY